MSDEKKDVAKVLKKVSKPINKPVHKEKRTWLKGSRSNQYVNISYETYGDEKFYCDAYFCMHDGGDVTHTDLKTIAEVDKVIGMLETLKGWMAKYGVQK